MSYKNYKLGIILTLVALFLFSSFIAAVGQEECKGSPDNPYISPERQQFLEGKPYKDITVDILIQEGPTANTWRHWAKEWEKLTGGNISLTEVPVSSHHQKIFTDLVTGMAQYDGYSTAAFYYGDYFSGASYIEPIKKFMEDPKLPYWCPESVNSVTRSLVKWNGKWYGVPDDGDAQVLYYRKDILSNEEYRNQFEEEYGYKYSIPPKDHQEMIDIAEFFNGWDWDNDGKKDYGYAGHYKVGGQGMWHYVSWAAPYVVSPENKHFWFNPDTMEPVIDSPGHLKALKDLKELTQYGPQGMMSWTLGEAWDLFLKGDAVLEFTWGDLGGLAQNEKNSEVKGKLGVAIISGVMKSYDPIEKKWITWDKPNTVGNNIGGSWHGVISKYSDNKQATYDFFAFMARADNAFWNQMRGKTGIDISRTFAFLKEDGGTATVEDYVEAANWNRNDAKEMASGFAENFSKEPFFPLLRIPGAMEYLRAIDVTVSRVLTGDLTPEAGMSRLNKRFKEITDRYDKEKQRKMLKQMLEAQLEG